jgi:formamidopyrimidine-DNA glycosylase
MPELPEVETVCRQLDPEIAGRLIVELEIFDERWSRPVPKGQLESAVAGARIEGLERRGKYLLLRLEGGRTLVMHLRMTGNLVLVERQESGPAEGDGRAGAEGDGRAGAEDDGRAGAEGFEDVGAIAKLDPSEGRRLYEGERSTSERHLRARFTLDDGREIWFTDPRRFGEAFLVEDEDELEARFERLGVEPFSEEFTAEALAEMASGRRVPLKSFLLDQSGVAGVGNIYADEALFRARLHPLSPAGSMRPEHHEALREGVIAALEAGIDGGGASIDDYRDGRGERGTMQERFLVHTREGEPCPSCGGPITRIVVSGRSTYYCPSCQIRLRRRPRRRSA